MGVWLTKAQRALLQFYEVAGPTAQSDAPGTRNTWKALMRKGLLRRSPEPASIQTEITSAGRSALASNAPPQ